MVNMKASSNGYLANSGEGERKVISSELWHACAGPLVSLPPVGSLVVYFPQGHSEQVAASMQKSTDSIPSYPNLPSKLICMLHNVTLHADHETDEVYTQMTLQPVSKYDQEALLLSDMGLKQNRQPAEFFCKTLTASDTSTHGGFSVPRRAAEKIFPPLDYTLQPPARELVARDLHDQSWTFRHIYRDCLSVSGQPKRHLLTTGWSIFVSSKRLSAGDSVLFIRDEKSQLLLGIRRANKQQPALSSSVISNDSMHIGILAAAAHAAANNSPFTIFYNPRASPSEFVIPLAKCSKAMYTQVSLGMRFRMIFETEECGVRRYMGTITGINDLDPVRWKNSQWRNLQVGWDESTAGDRPGRVSVWDIEPVVTPFYICPPPFFRPKFPRQPGFPDDESDIENGFKRGMPWLGDAFGVKDAPSSIFPGLSLVQWMSMQQNHQLSAPQSGLFPPIVSSNNLSTDDNITLLNFQNPALSAQSLQLSKASQQHQQPGQLQQASLAWPQQQLPQSSINPQLQRYLQQQPLPHSQQLPQQHLAEHQQQQQNIIQPAPVNNSLTANQVRNQSSLQPVIYSELQQQQSLTSSSQGQQNSSSGNRNSFPLTSLPQELQFQQQMNQQTSLLQRPQQQQTHLQQASLQLLQHSLLPRPDVQNTAQQSFSQQQLQLQLLQQLQQQQLLSPVIPHLETQLPQQKQVLDQNRHSQVPLSQQQHSSNSFSISTLMQSPQFPVNQVQVQQKPPVRIKGHSGPTNGDAPSCSTSPSTNNCVVASSNFLNRNQQSIPILLEDSVLSTLNVSQEPQSKSNIQMKYEIPGSKGPEQPKCKGTATTNDQLEEASSSTTYCLDTGGVQQNFSLPGFCVDGDVQSHSRNNIPFSTSIDTWTPDALLSRGFDSEKDIHNLLPNYGGTTRDIETELSTVGIGSQSFGVPNVSFKAGCSNDITINDTGILNSGLWPNQAQRMRTYTKVQKRGSVGRTIDVTRYKGYYELRHDLACMFGIEGQLEDPRRTEWKLVYVDHENDILLVGDDPWKEFVSCVQNIKILSSDEVQQMSLNGDLGKLAILNQACSGTDSGNAWRGHYDDNSAASFNP